MLVNNFPFSLSNLLFPWMCCKIMGFLFFNPLLKAIETYYAFLYKTFSCFLTDGFFLHDFPWHILNRRNGPACLLNSFVFYLFYFFTAKSSLLMFEAFRLSVMSSFFVRFKSSFRYNIIVVLKKRDSDQH